MGAMAACAFLGEDRFALLDVAMSGRQTRAVGGDVDVPPRDFLLRRRTAKVVALGGMTGARRDESRLRTPRERF